MDFLTDPIFPEFGRSDFIGGIDNEALDFGHLEQFIQVSASTGGSGGGGGDISPTVSSVDVNDVLIASSANNSSSIASTQTHLPESPPDSGSEPPYSPGDLQGLTLTSRATSNCNAGNDGSIMGARSPIGGGHPQIKTSTDMQPLTHIPGVPHQIQHQHNHNIQQQHSLYVEHPEQHSLLLTATPHIHQQVMHHAEPNATPAGGVYSPDNRHDRMVAHQDTLLDIESQQPHQKSIHVASMREIIDMEPQRSTYNRQSMLLNPQHQQLTSSIIPSDVYMGTPAPIIESPSVHAPTRKRKLSQVDCCASMMTIKPEPGASLSPICQQKMNPPSPVSISLQGISAGGGSGGGSPSLSSLSPTATSLSLSNDNNSLDGGSGTPNGAGFVGSNATDSSSESSPMQCIRFSPFQQHNWHTLCDQSLQELTMAHYRVDADKGFNFSVSDDAFVCQKKNHFQITCHARLQGDAKFVRTPSGLEKIKSFHLHFYGVKLEAPNQTIRVEQSQSDRSKKPFYPVPIDLQSHLVSKVTVGRLHFSETTNNNMRKKGRPNPEQRYFQLVVGLHVHTHSGHFPVVSQGSERIIVRASNPGQFESDVELCWQRGITPESIFHAGRVGINTDRPDESLVIHGNLKVSGHIIQPSDSRAKQEISELDTAVQLKNLQKIRIVRYRYEPEFALHSGLKSRKDNEEIVDTGVIAQEVREVLPDAVQEAGSIVLPSGQVIENFLLVNKDRILMENIGAVKELCKVTGSLETRIEQLEKINNRLMRMQEVDRNKTRKCKHFIEDGLTDVEDELCSNRTIQMMIIILVIIMATCLVAVSTLYFVEHSKQRYIKHFDHYDIGHHLSPHDTLLMNDNGARNPIHTSYHTNKNGKLNQHTHTPRPPAPHPIQHPQLSVKYPYLGVPPNIPISVIPTSYPSAGAGAGAGSDPSIIHGSNPEGDTYEIQKLAASQEKTIDDHSSSIERPVVPGLSITAANHLNNKTASSKNKSKWPLPDTTIAVSSTITLAYNYNDEAIEENINGSETSSEKVADSIPLPQDFENNSIDGVDASQKSDPRGNGHGSDPVIDHGTTLRSSGHEVPENSVASVGIGVDGAKLDTTADVVLKNIEGNNINDTVSQHVNFTIDTPPITNKSRGLDTEDTDLQYLGNNNDSDDQNLADIGSIPMVTKSFTIGPVGIPAHCVKIKREEVSNCQSACFEDTNNLPSQTSDSDINPRHILATITNLTSSSSAALGSGISKPLPKPQSLIDGPIDVTASVERDQVEDVDDDQDNASSQSQQVIQQQLDTTREELSLALKDKKPPHKDAKRKVDTIEVSEHRPLSDCTSITAWLQADTFNVSLGSEEICLNGGSSLNITYAIPLSKYLKDTNLELHFVAPVSLQWAVCSHKEVTKPDGNSAIIPLSNGKIFQKNQNAAIFYIIIPGHGHFERLVKLRGAMDSTRNLCREQADETNILLQYNIRILRDCD